MPTASRRATAVTEPQEPEGQDPVSSDRGGPHDADWLRLRAAHRPVVAQPTRVMTVVDAFSGGGILSVGAIEAAVAAQMACQHVAHIENWPEAARVYQHNHPGVLSYDDVERVAGGDIGSDPTEAERVFRDQVLHRAGGTIDVLMGGPPCQGHSNLNNHTRRTDAKNALYLRMARLAELLQPRLVLIENVPGVTADHGNIVDRTKQALICLGYSISHRVIRASDLGVAQSRKRFILVAVRGATCLDLDALVATPKPPRNILWAIGDLDERTDHPTSSRLWTAKRGTVETQRRIAYLFTHNLHNLPNSERPDCHRLKEHNYSAVYGRMFADRPAPTITGGFGTQGQGRFVHPTKPRVMTPREALRCQDVPDWYDIPDALGLSVADMHQVIGNGAPPAYARLVIGAAIAQGIIPSRATAPTATAATAPNVNAMRLDLLAGILRDMPASTRQRLATDPVVAAWAAAGVALLDGA